MASFKALCLAGVASLAVTAVASAADLLPPPPPPEAPIYAPPVEVGSGWYLRGDVGVGVNKISEGTSTFDAPIPDFGSDGYNLKESGIIGVGGGYQVNNYFRADVTGEYRTAAHYSAAEHYSGSPNCATGAGYLCVDGYKGSISSAVFLINGYVQIGTWYGVTPYLGAGVGAAFNTFAGLADYGISNPGAYGTATDQTAAHLAYALMAGFSYDLTQNLKVDIGYRYLDMGHVISNSISCTLGCPHEVQSYKLASHDVRIGLRYMFADMVPYAQPTLIRKY